MLKRCSLLPTCLFAAAAATANVQPVHPYNKDVDDGDYGYYPTRSYATELDLTSPRVNWLQWTPECDDGRLHFLTPRGGYVSKPGPMILDANGELVWSHWFDNDFGGQAYNFQVQQYQGQDYLTFWLGDDAVKGHGEGKYYMLNSSYDLVHTVDGRNGQSADLHEFAITPQGTALLSVYEVAPYNLTSFREADWSDRPREGAEDEDRNFIWDCLIQEVSIDSGDLLFEWRATDHIDLTDTYHNIVDRGGKEWAFDWYHINSIMKDHVDNYLISARYTHSVTYIDGKTGEILWVFGGKRNKFMDLSDGAGLNFAWQHDARFHAPDAFPEIYSPPPSTPGLTRQLLTIFDNAAQDQVYEYGTEAARGLLLELTYPTSPGAEAIRKHPASSAKHGLSNRDVNEEKLASINGTDPRYTVRVIHSYENPRRTRSSSQGSMQVLPADEQHRTKVLIGYGLNAIWTEYDANGTVLCDVHYGSETSFEEGHIQSYRTYKYPWTGHPTTPPKLAIDDEAFELYVSWNGATEVRQWLLQASKYNVTDDARWSDIARVDKAGFETSIELSTVDRSMHFLRVLALGQDGRAMAHGASNVLDDRVLPSSWDPMDSNTPKHIDNDGINAFFLVILAVIASFALYDLIKRIRSWRISGPAAGRFRWRQGLRYNILRSEA